MERTHDKYFRKHCVIKWSLYYLVNELELLAQSQCMKFGRHHYKFSVDLLKILLGCRKDTSLNQNILKTAIVPSSWESGNTYYVILLSVCKWLKYIDDTFHYLLLR